MTIAHNRITAIGTSGVRLLTQLREYGHRIIGSRWQHQLKPSPKRLVRPDAPILARVALTFQKTKLSVY